MLLLFNCISRFIYRVTNELHFFIQRKRNLKMLIIVNAVTIQVRQTFFSCGDYEVQSPTTTGTTDSTANLTVMCRKSDHGDVFEETI